MPKFTLSNTYKIFPGESATTISTFNDFNSAMYAWQGVTSGYDEELYKIEFMRGVIREGGMVDTCTVIDREHCSISAIVTLTY